MAFGDKRTPLKRKTPLKAKSTLRGIKLAPKPSKRKKRDKLPATKTMRNKCDKLLTPIIKLKHPHCFLRAAEMCAGETQVAHHHVLKSKSSRLRYEIDNLIPLCNRCHALLHSHETYWSSVIVEKKGMDWWLDLKAKKDELVKTDVHFYIENYNRLRAILDELEK